MNELFEIPLQGDNDVNLLAYVTDVWAISHVKRPLGTAQLQNLTNPPGTSRHRKKFTYVTRALRTACANAGASALEESSKIPTNEHFSCPVFFVGCVHHFVLCMEAHACSPHDVLRSASIRCRHERMPARRDKTGSMRTRARILHLN